MVKGCCVWGNRWCKGVVCGGANGERALGRKSWGREKMVVGNVGCIFGGSVVK